MSDTITATYISFYLRTCTIRVFKKAVLQIGPPKYVKFLVNPQELRMAMIPYDKKELTSFRVPKHLTDERCSTSLRIASKDFCYILANRMGWDVSKSYRVPGLIYSKTNIVKFDLKKAVEITDRGNDL